MNKLKKYLNMNRKFLFAILFVFLMPAAFSQYFNTTQISMLMGHRPLINQYSYNLNNLLVYPSVTMTNGGMFNEHWAAGVGIGVELFDHKLFPLFVDIRYTLWDNTVSPFFAFKLGYAFSDLKKKHYDELNLNYEPYYVNDVYLRNYGGLMVHPEMGVRIPLTENADLLLTVAYRRQKTKSTASQDFGSRNTWNHEESMNRLSFGFAITFR